MQRPTDFLCGASGWFRFVAWSAAFGFVALPVHEFGHVLGYRMLGIPAAMSYTREWQLHGEADRFLGVAGGPLFMALLCAAALVLVYRKTWLTAAFPIAVILSGERILKYGQHWRWLLVRHRATPGMDETEMAGLLGWNPFSWYVLLTLFYAAAWIVILSRLRYGARRNALVCVVPLSLYVAMSLLGIFVVERNFFPKQFHLQFG